MSDDDGSERILWEFEDAHDDLEEMVQAAEDRDGDAYFRDLKIRVRKADGLIFLSLTWYRKNLPSASIVRAPSGYWMSRWYKAIDKNGVAVWESVLGKADQ